MAGETVLTIIGNLTGPPELKFLPSGVAVANLTVASTPRTFDRQANEFKDGETVFMPVTAWRELAENVADTLDKGMRVVVVGRLTQENWEDRNGGGKRSRMVLQADEVAPSLRYASAKVTRTQRQGSGTQDDSWKREAVRATTPRGDDPWATQGGGSYSDEPPF